MTNNPVEVILEREEMNFDISFPYRLKEEVREIQLDKPLSIEDHLIDKFNLRNRKYFDIKQNQLLLDCELRKSEDYTLGIFDIDGFKSVNDSLGHRNGDTLIEAIGNTASALSSEIFGEDYIYHLSGDEYAVLIPGDISDEKMIDFSKRMCFIEKKIPYDGNTLIVELGCSMGFIKYSQINRIDNALRDIACIRDLEGIISRVELDETSQENPLRVKPRDLKKRIGEVKERNLSFSSFDQYNTFTKDLNFVISSIEEKKDEERKKISAGLLNRRSTTTLQEDLENGLRREILMSFLTHKADLESLYTKSLGKNGVSIYKGVDERIGYIFGDASNEVQIFENREEQKEQIKKVALEKELRGDER